MDYIREHLTAYIVIVSLIIIALIVIIVWLSMKSEGAYPGELSEETKALIRYKAMADPIMTERLTAFNPKLFEGLEDKEPRAQNLKVVSDAVEEHPKLVDLLY